MLRMTATEGVRSICCGRGRYRLLLLVTALQCYSVSKAFLARPNIRLPVRPVQGRHCRALSGRSRGVCQLSLTPEDKVRVQTEFEGLLEAKKPVELVDFLTRHRSDVDVDWEKAKVLLDAVSNSQPFRQAAEERLAKDGRASSGVNDMDRFSAAPAAQFMYLEEFQREQFEAVQYVYSFLKEKQLLRAFSCIQDAKGYSDAFLAKNVPPEEIEKRSDLPMTALAPGTGQNLWVYAGGLICLLEVVICSYVGVDAGAVIPLTVIAFLADRILAGGFVFDQVARVVLPRYKERVVRHEAGHFLIAYLLGCPVQNCILRPVLAGSLLSEAGTVFVDKRLFDELQKNRISASSVDRYTTIVMAGIAAEALSFKNAEGGSSDEQSILLLLSLMQPPWDFTRIANQARWAALRALLMLKDYSNAYESLVQALLRGESVGACVRVIEEALKDAQPLVPTAALAAPSSSTPERKTAEFDDLQRVLLPVGGASAAEPPESSAHGEHGAMEGASPVEPEPVVTPSFETGGVDMIKVQEEKEELAALESDRKYRERMRELELRLKMINARIAGKSDAEVAKEVEMEERKVTYDIDSQLSELENRVKEIKSMLRSG